MQHEIASECALIDGERQEALREVKRCKEGIAALFADASLQASEVLRLSDKSAFSVSIGKRVLASEFVEGAKIPVYSANVFEPFGFVDELLPSLTDFSVDSVLWGIDGDWQVNTIKAGQAFYPTDHCGVLRVKNGVVEPLYLAWALNEEGKRVGFSRNYRASIDRIESLSLRFPPLAVPRALVESRLCWMSGWARAAVRLHAVVDSARLYRAVESTYTGRQRHYAVCGGAFTQ